MSARFRAVLLGLRPPVLLLALLVLGLGWVSGGGSAALTSARDVGRALLAVVVVGAVTVFGVLINDLVDERVDRVNLPDDPSRWLVGGTARRTHLRVLAVGCGLVALVGASVLGVDAVLLVVGGVLVGLAYSLPPLRLSGRGVIAPLVLPLCFVVVPFGVSLTAADGRWTTRDAVLVAGLYLGFIGRLLLKDFRDVRGDALFGKRTFLVRHGRTVTLLLSGMFWVAGSVLLVIVGGAGMAFVGCVVACLLCLVGWLRRLSTSTDRQVDERTISAIAIIGRTELVVLLAQLAAAHAGWASASTAVLLVAITVVGIGQATQMARLGPTSRPRSAEQWAQLDDLVPPRADADG